MEWSRMNKQISRLILFLIILLFFAVSNDYQGFASKNSTNITIFVDDDGNADFRSIQDAVDAANPQDIIYVYPGTYHESIVIDKSNITIMGEHEKHTIIKGNINQNVIEITSESNNISLSHFTIEVNPIIETGLMASAINNFGNYVIIENNIITQKNFKQYSNGIMIVEANNNIIHQNSITNLLKGIFSISSGYNKITDNNISYCTTAIVDIESNAQEIYHNEINENGMGIEFIYSKLSTISYNTISSNDNSIYIHGNDNSVHHNIIYGNERDGVVIINSYNNTISDNKISSNDNGIMIRSCEHLIIANNHISSNGNDGICLHDSSLSLIDTCLISANFRNGITIENDNFVNIESKNISIINCEIKDHTENGILFEGKNKGKIHNNIIKKCNILKNFRGIKLIGNVKTCEFINNNLKENYWGIKLSESEQNLIDKCLFEKNYCGIMRGKNNIIRNNDFIENKICHVLGEIGFVNHWIRNYWSGHHSFFPCFLYIGNFDWFPKPIPHRGI